MAVAEPIRKLTEAEYFELERAAESKSEFFDGEIFAMSGGTPRHSQIGANLIGELRGLLRGGTCRPYTSDLRLKVEICGLITYPDMSVVCGPLEFADGTDDTVVNPTLVAEVLSPGTEGCDRGRKFENYRLIPSLREYLLIRQDAPQIEQFIKSQRGEWTLRAASGTDASLALSVGDVRLKLSEVYLDVVF